MGSIGKGDHGHVELRHVDSNVNNNSIFIRIIRTSVRELTRSRAIEKATIRSAMQMMNFSRVPLNKCVYLNLIYVVTYAR